MTKGTKLFGFLLCGSLAACSGPQDPTLRSTPELAPTIQAAVNIWNPLIEPCGRHLTITEGDPDFAVYYGDAGTSSNGMPNPGDTSIRYGSQSTVVISHAADSDSDGLLKVVVHELGHVLGAEHSSDINDVMFPWENGVMTPSAHDVQVVCAL
jgi:hypothetical protein